ncbi:hypothetical protein QTO34_015578 [Cnephaeus nilssonii]|uniref:Uncharacterized protein n=1 Tax=Cnephaeus nilssonii TaxID=3371016 RepID=A0AA40LQU8_CNENI|nr:hypothetical protein QTO34_015578 [Eptesicus nilssonii]
MSSSAETVPISSQVPTDAVTEVARTEGVSSSRTFSSGLQPSTGTPDISIGMPWLSNSPSMTEATDGTLSTPTGQPRATSEGKTPLDTLTTSSSPGTHRAATQNFTHSQVTTLGNRGPEDVSRTSPPFVETSSSPSLESAPSTVSPSSVSSLTRPESGSSPPPLVTSAWTSGLLPGTDALGTSVDPRAQSTPQVSESTAQRLDSWAPSTGTEAVHLSGHTAETSVGTTNFGQETHSSAPGELGPPEVTSPVVTPSIMRETRVSAPVPGSTETTWTVTESASSTSHVLGETSPSQPMSSAAETVPVSSQVPTDAVTEVAKTEGVSSSGTFSSGPLPTTGTADISTGMSGLSTSAGMTEAEDGTISTLTGQPGATLQGTTPLETLTTASSPGTHRAATQGITHSQVTTLGSRRPKDVSRTSPPFVETSSSPSLESAPSTVSPSSVSSPTRPESGSSPPALVTSAWTSDLLPGTDALGTSVDPGAHSTPYLTESTAQSLDSWAPSTGTEAVHLSGHTAETSVGTTSFGQETHSSAPGESGPPEVTTPVVTPSIMRETRVSAPVPGSSVTTWSATESASSTSPGLRETSQSPPMSSAAETGPVSSQMPTDAVTEVARKEVLPSSGIFYSGPPPSSRTPDISTGMPGLSTSSGMTEAAEGTFTTPTGQPRATSQGTIPLDTLTTASRPGTHGAATQGITHSQVTTHGSREPEDVSRTTPPFVETSTSPSLKSTPSTVSPSSVSSPTRPESGSSPPPLVTSAWTSDLLPGTDALGTSVDPETHSTPYLTESTAQSLDSWAPSTGTEAVHLSGHTAETSVGTTSFGQETHSSVPGESGPPEMTSPVVTPSIMRETRVSAPVPGSSETTWSATESASSTSPGLRETSQSPPMSSAGETGPISSQVPTDAVTEVAKTEGMSSSGTFSSGPPPSTGTADISTGMPWLSTSPGMTEAAEETLTTPTGQPGATSQGTTLLDTWNTASSPGTHGAATQGFKHSQVTTLRSRGPEYVSRTSPPFVETSSSPSLESAPSTVSPSPISSPTRPESGSSPPPLVTSAWTSGLLPATEALGTSVDPGAQSTPHVSESTAQSLDSWAPSTGTEAVHLSGHTAETSVGTTSFGQETHSSAPGESGPPEMTSPVVTPSIMKETRVSAPVPGSSETTTTATESASSRSPVLRETSHFQPMSSVSEMVLFSSQVPTDAVTGVDRTEGMSSSGTFYSGMPPSLGHQKSPQECPGSPPPQA